MCSFTGCILHAVVHEDQTNDNEIKFKVRTTKLTKVLNSPCYRWVRLWDGLAEDIQRATTKVNLRSSFSKIRTDTAMTGDHKPNSFIVQEYICAI